MAVKGYLTIEEADGDYSLVKAEDADFEILANGERRAAKRIFSAGNSIELDNKNHEALGKSVNNLRESLKVEYERAYFKHNTGLFFIGVASSVVLIIFSGSLGNDPGLFVRAMIQAGVAGVIVFIVLHFWGDDSDPTFKAVPFKSVNTRALTVTVLNIIIFGTIIAIQSMAALSISLFSNAIQSICFAMIGGLNVIFFFLMKKPTLAGRSIMDEIEGFRQYLSVAEEARLNQLNPPEKTPELFETLSALCPGTRCRKRMERTIRQDIDTGQYESVREWLPSALVPRQLLEAGHHELLQSKSQLQSGRRRRVVGHSAGFQFR